jgi:hypothetical protein
MSPKTPLQDSNFEWNQQAMMDAYKEAAEADHFLFGDFDYSDVWNNIESNDVY